MKAFLAWCGYTLLCAASLSAGAAVGLFQENPLLFVAMRYSMPFVQPRNPFELRDEFFVLVLGCDENRAYGGKVLNTRARTDTIQLVRFDFKNRAIGMMQIPRDTVAAAPGVRTQKINAMHVFGGPELTAAAVAGLVDIRPDRTIVLDYGAIRRMVDVVGGVEVFVEKRMKYRDRRGDLNIDLRPGRQKLDGRRAIGFMRYRQDNDFKRGKRQQEFMVAFKNKVASQHLGISDIVRLSDLAMQVVGGGISEEEFFYLAQFAQAVSPSRIKHGMLPVTEGSVTNLYPDRSRIPQALVESGLRDPVAPTISRQ